MHGHTLRWLLLGSGLLGCDGSDEAESSSATSAGAGGGGACAAGETAADQGCQPAGVPADRCAAGFVPDERGGCRAIMPEAPCARGQMAVPGEMSCREVAPCGDDRWGEIPIEATTQFVDATSVGGDGSAEAPWATIAEAVDAAVDGAIVAIAAGSYEGDVSLLKPVRLWGRCPAMVEILGDGSRPAAVFVESGADGAEVRGVALRGPMLGFAISGSENVLVDQVWIEATGSYGVALREVFGHSAITLTRSLIESTGGAGIVVEGSDITVEEVEVRDVGAAPGGDGGYALFAGHDAEGFGRPRVTVRGSAILRARTAGIGLDGADAVIEATLIADSIPQDSGRFGRGLLVQHDAVSGEPSVVTVAGSVVERCRELGISVEASELTLEASVIRDMQPRALDLTLGRAIHVQSALLDTTLPSKVTVRDSLVDRALDVGIVVTSSEAVIERALVRDTLARASDALFGDGLSIATPSGSARATITSSRFEAQPRAAISGFGASAVSVAGTRFECNSIDLDVEVLAGQEAAFEDAGGNVCGCGAEAEACIAQTSNLAPPAPAD